MAVYRCNSCGASIDTEAMARGLGYGPGVIVSTVISNCRNCGSRSISKETDNFPEGPRGGRNPVAKRKPSQGTKKVAPLTHRVIFALGVWLGAGFLIGGRMPILGVLLAAYASYLTYRCLGSSRKASRRADRLGRQDQLIQGTTSTESGEICKAYVNGRCINQQNGTDTGPCSWQPANWQNCAVVSSCKAVYGKW